MAERTRAPTTPTTTTKQKIRGVFFELPRTLQIDDEDIPGPSEALGRLRSLATTINSNNCNVNYNTNDNSSGLAIQFLANAPTKSAARLSDQLKFVSKPIF
jgi:hypothetical protein